MILYIGEVNCDKKETSAIHPKQFNGLIFLIFNKCNLIRKKEKSILDNFLPAFEKM